MREKVDAKKFKEWQRKDESLREVLHSTAGMVS